MFFECLLGVSRFSFLFFGSPLVFLGRSAPSVLILPSHDRICTVCIKHDKGGRSALENLRKNKEKLRRKKDFVAFLDFCNCFNGFR